MDVGEDTGTPVVRDYFDKMPYAYSSHLGRVIIDLDNPPADSKDAVEKNDRETAAAVAVLD